MANNPSALKRVRQTQTRTLRNKALKTRVKTLRKSIDAAVAGGDRSAIDKAVSEYTSAVDRATKNNIFHRNKAANLKQKAAAASKASSN